MLLAILAVICGLVLLVKSATWFIDGAATLAWYFGIPPILIGMLIIGFGTSAPELGVSTLSSLQGNAGIALGNAYGSNIANIGLILGLTAILYPISMESKILRKELPVLFIVTLLVIYQLVDSHYSRTEAAVLLALFVGMTAWLVWIGLQKKSDSYADEVQTELRERLLSRQRAYIMLGGGILLLLASSRLLVWGAVEIAREVGVTDMVIGLTVVAVGTSLPELASSVAAAKRNEHDMVIGNIIGSNLFNCMVVAGIAGLIQPTDIEPDIIRRDLPVVAAFTGSLFIFGYGFKGQGRINRWEGVALSLAYALYVAYLLKSYAGN